MDWSTSSIFTRLIVRQFCVVADEFAHERPREELTAMTSPENLENIPLDIRVKAILNVVEGMFYSKSEIRNDLERCRSKQISESARSLSQPRYKIVIALNTGLRLTSSEHLNLMILQALRGNPDELDTKLEAMQEREAMGESSQLALESTRRLIGGK